MDAYTLARMPSGRLHMLGSGAFGVVVKATRNSDGLVVAMKLIFCSNKEQVEDARAEAVLAGDSPLVHPNIIRLHEFTVLTGSAATELQKDVKKSLPDLGDRDIPKFFRETDGLRVFRRTLHAVCVLPYDFVDGPDLFDWFLARGSPNLSEDDARLVFRQFVAGVAHMHAAGFAHRDIKLENAMVVAKDNALRVIDFGMATRARTVEGPSAMGSPTYIAPELRGPGQHDLFAADVFSLGVTLYIMALGAMPWTMSDRSCGYFRSFQAHVANSYPGESVVRRYGSWCERQAGSQVCPTPAPASTAASAVVSPASSPPAEAPPPQPSLQIASSLSQRLVSLLDACLALEPERRPTAAALLEHPWFDPTAEDEEEPVYRSLGDDDELVIEGADAMPPPPTPSRQAAFKGQLWEDAEE